MWALKRVSVMEEKSFFLRLSHCWSLKSCTNCDYPNIPWNCFDTRIHLQKKNKHSCDHKILSQSECFICRLCYKFSLIFGCFTKIRIIKSTKGCQNKREWFKFLRKPKVIPFYSTLYFFLLIWKKRSDRHVLTHMVYPRLSDSNHSE